MGTRPIQSGRSLLEVTLASAKEPGIPGEHLVGQETSIFRTVDVSQDYKNRIDRILSRMKKNGLDPKAHGKIHYAGYPFLGTFLAAVLHTNEMYIGSTTGMEDWEAELILVHEARHQLQNEEIWNRISASEGLNPKKCPLKSAFTGKNLPRGFERVKEKYLEENRNMSVSTMELDAYVFAYDYYKQNIEKKIDEGKRYLFLFMLDRHLKMYLGNGLPPEMINVVRKIGVIQRELLYKTDSLKNRKTAAKVAKACRKYLDQTTKKYADDLHFSNGNSYSLQERLLTLPAGLDATISVAAFADEVANAYPSAARYFRPLAETANKETLQIDNYLDRQTLGYQRQFSSPLPHSIDYRNDLIHFSTGVWRAQWFGEFDFGGTDEVHQDTKLGIDSGFYAHFSDHIFAKIAPAVYMGYQTGLGNAIGGARLDLELHLDIDITQRTGTSLYAGYALGAQAGLKKGNFYDEARLGLQLFHF
ncbi:MAG: hypothetical protein Q7T03_01435 [Deltaproteobacteria bacterium]|nr:hypothetical protein [Deltaproteobacteria bacterium]